MLGGFQWAFNNLILQWTIAYTGIYNNLPTSFNTVYRWTCGYLYYNNNLTSVKVSTTNITTEGGPPVQVPINVIAIGI